MNTNPFKLGQEVNWFDPEGRLHSTPVVEITQHTTLVQDPGGGYRELKTETLELFNLPVGSRVEVRNTLGFGECANIIADIRSVELTDPDDYLSRSITYDLKYDTLIGSPEDAPRVHLTGMEHGEPVYGGVMIFGSVLKWPEPPKKRPRKILGLVI